MTRVNLITNPSFEYEIGPWWAQNITATRNAIEHARGNACARLQVTAAGAAYINGGMFNTAPGRTYTLSMYVRTNSTTVGDWAAYVEFYSDFDTWGWKGSAQSSTFKTTAGAWSRISVTFTMPAGAYGFIPYLNAWNAGVGDVVFLDAVLLEESPTMGTYFDGDTNGYEWDGEPHESTSSSEVVPLPSGTPIQPNNHTRLEVHNGTAWVNITGPTKNITIDRSDSDVGLMTAEVLDASLDPVNTSTLRPGKRVRVSALDGSTWRALFTGYLDNVNVDYEPLANEGKRTNVRISASDAVSYFANAEETRGVGTINELRWLLNGAGIPFNINGQTTTLSSGTIIATNDNGTLWDSVQLAKDTNLGYAWVDTENRLRVYDLAQMDNTVKATLNPNVYRSVDSDFNLDQIINSVVVKWLRYDVGTETTSEVTYPAVEDAASIAEWGRRQAVFTIGGAVENETAITTFANKVLARSATAVVRPNTADLRIKRTGDIQYALLDLNDRVSVVMTDGTTTHDMRIAGIKHTISTKGWDVQVEFRVPNSVNQPNRAPSTGVPTVPGGYVKPEDLDENINEVTEYIDNAINAIAQEVVDLNATVDTVLTSANGKSKNYYSPTAPTGGTYNVGDAWFDSDNNYFMRVWNGSTWSETFSVPDGSIASQHVITAGLDAGIIKFGEMEGSRIKTGTLQIGQVSGLNTAISGAQSGAVTQVKNLWGFPSNNTFIDGGKIYTHSIRANQLAISDFTNYIPSPLEWTGAAVTGANTDTLGEYAVLKGNGSSNTHAGTGGPDIPVKPGDQFHFQWDAYANYAGQSGSVAAYFIFLNGSGSVVSTAVGAIVAQGTTTYTTKSVEITVPANAAFMRFSPFAEANAQAAVRRVQLRLKYGGELIVDGAITTDQLAANAITSKHTITGATLQTSATANRGLKINSLGLTAYDASGNTTFVINASTGGVAMIGDLNSGSQATFGSVSNNHVQIRASADPFGATGTNINFKTGTAENGSVWANGGGMGLYSTKTIHIAAGPAGYTGSAKIVLGDDSILYDIPISSLSGPTAHNQPGTHLFQGTMRLRLNSSGDSSTAFHVNYEGGAYFPLLTTTTDPANVRISSNGRIYGVTSRRDTKAAIEPIETERAKSILDVPLVSWYDLANAERYAKAIEEDNEELLDDVEVFHRIPGLIAEDVEATGLHEFVQYDRDGNVQGVAYDRIALTLIPLVKELYERVEQLEQALT